MNPLEQPTKFVHNRKTKFSSSSSGHSVSFRNGTDHVSEHVRRIACLKLFHSVGETSFYRVKLRFRFTHIYQKLSRLILTRR